MRHELRPLFAAAFASPLALFSALMAGDWLLARFPWLAPARLPTSAPYIVMAMMLPVFALGLDRPRRMRLGAAALFCLITALSALVTLVIAARLYPPDLPLGKAAIMVGVVAIAFGGVLSGARAVGLRPSVATAALLLMVSVPPLLTYLAGEVMRMTPDFMRAYSPFWAWAEERQAPWGIGLLGVFGWCAAGIVHWRVLRRVRRMKVAAIPVLIP